MNARDFTIQPQWGRDLDRVQQRSLAVGIVALLLCILGAMFRPDQFSRSWAQPEAANPRWPGSSLVCGKRPRARY